MSSPAAIDVVLGHHWLLELHGCERARLDDVAGLERACVDAARAAGATVVEARFHRFEPHGVSGVVLLAESHLTLHTWPEHRYAAADLFSCSLHIDPAPAAALLAARVGASDSLVSARLRRGALGPLPALDLRAERSSLAWRDRFAPGSLLHVHIALELHPERSLPALLDPLVACLAADPDLAPLASAAPSSATTTSLALRAGTLAVHLLPGRAVVDLHLTVFREPTALASALSSALAAPAYTLRAEIDGPVTAR